jgi:hypothetical protein
MHSELQAQSCQVFIPSIVITSHSPNHITGNYETIKKGDVPCIGITRLTPENVKKLMARKGEPIGPLNRWIAQNNAASATSA